jgi:hypothetical protein
MGFSMFFRILFATAFALSLFMPVYADSPGIMESNDVIIQYDEPLKNAAREIIKLYPHVRRELEGVLGWQIDFKPLVVLVKDHEKFQEISGSQYITAFAVSERKLIVVDYSRMNINPFTLEVTLKHEMCHLLLGDRIPDVRLPRWLNEGFCQWVTGGVAELMVDGRQPSLSIAMLSNRVIPLAFLQRRFPSDRDDLILAYEESKSVVDYMVAENGRNSVTIILDHLGEGDTIDEATKKALSVSLDEFERQWISYLKGRVTWIGYLAANIYMILLFAAALLTICGFIRLIIRRRHRASEIDENGELDTD